MKMVFRFESKTVKATLFGECSFSRETEEAPAQVVTVSQRL